MRTLLRRCGRVGVCRSLCRGRDVVCLSRTDWRLWVGGAVGGAADADVADSDVVAVVDGDVLVMSASAGAGGGEGFSMRCLEDGTGAAVGDSERSRLAGPSTRGSVGACLGNSGDSLRSGPNRFRGWGGAAMDTGGDGERARLAGVVVDVVGDVCCDKTVAYDRDGMTVVDADILVEEGESVETSGVEEHEVGTRGVVGDGVLAVGEGRIAGERPVGVEVEASEARRVTVGVEWWDGEVGRVGDLKLDNLEDRRRLGFDLGDTLVQGPSY